MLQLKSKLSKQIIYLDPENGDPVIFYLQHLSSGICKRIRKRQVLGSESPGCAVFAADKGQSHGIPTPSLGLTQASVMLGTLVV